MKFTKYIVLGAAALVAGASLSAKTDKDLKDLRIYINPGHGGWDGGDRHMGTVKHGAADYLDTCGFFETNTNTWKGLATLQLLADYGFKYDRSLNPFPADFVGYRCNDNLHDIQTNGDPDYRYGAARDLSQGLVMSHVKNGLSRNINEIAKEVEANNFDLFLSIHSNAASSNTTNYPAMFIRGENKTASSPGSDDFARTVWPYAYSNTHANWSNYSMTNPALYYDIDFWGGDYATTDHGNGNIVKGYYAVLRHNVPGMLIEGYFHTYEPARHRAMNPDVCRIEGEAYARGIAEYFGVAKEETGDIYGIVRDLHEKFRHTYYHASSSSADAYLPVNNAEVKLMDETGKVVATYTTDDEFNGAFVFRKLRPGKYTIAVSAENYKAADELYCGPFEVKAAEVVYPDVYIESLDYVPPTAPTSDYTDEVNVPYIKAGDAYSFNHAVADKELAQLEGKTVKRFIAKGDRIYVLAHDASAEPSVYVLDATTLDVLAEVSTVGTEGTVNRLADIQVTADGVLVASAAQLNFSDESQVEAGETMGECNFYKWANGEDGLPAGDPVKWFGTPATANFFRGVTGFTFAYSGTADEGFVYLPSYSTYYERKVWLNVLDIVDGVLSSSRYVNSTRDNMNMDALGEDVTISVSPVKSGSFIVSSSKVAQMQFNADDYMLERVGSVNFPAREGYFKFAGAPMMAVADIDAEGNHGGVVLYNIADGIAKPRAVETSNTSIEAVKEASTASAGRTVVQYDADDNIVAADIDLYTLRGNRVNRFTTAGVTQAPVRGNFAYDLRQTGDENNRYTLSFSLTDDAHAVVEAYAPEWDGKYTLADDNFVKGVNTVEVDGNEMEARNYNWRVIVDNPTVPAVATVFDSKVVSSGVAIDRDPESDMFGNVYVSQKDPSRAVVGYNAAFEPIAGSPFMPNMWDTSVGASPWRLTVLPTGKLLVSDWSDKNGGIYLFDPANPERGRFNFFPGTIKPSSGEWILDGQTYGGSTSGMSVVGTGDETRLVTFQEDWPSDYALNLVYYNIGTADQITTQPVQPANFKTVSAYLINGNVEVIANEKGMVLGQVRGAGNNAQGVPCFLVTDPEGKILFNSGADWAELTGSTGMFALSDDASKLLVQDEGHTVYVCDVTWEPEFSITPAYTFDLLKDGGSDSNSYQATFDPAGNLYVANRSSMRVITLPREASQAVTPAKAEYTLQGTLLGVDDITVEEPAGDGAVRYYDLRGIEMTGDNLPAGIYIRRQGNTATKVIVR